MKAFSKKIKGIKPYDFCRIERRFPGTFESLVIYCPVPMKVLLAALSALALAASPASAQTPTEAATAAAPQSAATAEKDSKAKDELLLPVQKITRWEDTGMTPVEAREWQTYAFTPHDATNWKHAGFTPLVARTWSDKGFDADEAREWLDSTKSSRTMMADLDHSDPAQWKREGLTPRDRLAWWEAGFAFDDAIILFRAGMTPADAAWHGQEKLKELKDQGNAAKGGAEPATASISGALQGGRAYWDIIGPYVTMGAVAFVAFITGGLAFFLLRRTQVNRELARIKSSAPDSEMPSVRTRAAGDPTTSATGREGSSRRPARRFTLALSTSPHCIHCKSTDVRLSRMHPHRFAGINFTEYFRCKHCGKHFAIVSYTPILAAGSAVVVLLTAVTSGFIYLVSMVH